MEAWWSGGVRRSRSSRPWLGPSVTVRSERRISTWLGEPSAISNTGRTRSYLPTRSASGRRSGCSVIHSVRAMPCSPAPRSRGRVAALVRTGSCRSTSDSRRPRVGKASTPSHSAREGRSSEPRPQAGGAAVLTALRARDRETSGQRPPG